MSNILITGIDGFVASHLLDYILEVEPNAHIVGTKRRLANPANYKKYEKRINLIDMELTDPYSVYEAIRQTQPHKIFHLAAQTFVPESWTSPTGTMNTNVNGTINILEACRKNYTKPFIQIVGSSEEYGNCGNVTITEDTPLLPLSPYGVSKVATDLLGYQYAKSYGMNIVRTRSFNMTGPRRGEQFFDSAFAKKIIQIENRMCGNYFPVGNLEAHRDLTDVRDAVRAYWMLSEYSDLEEIRGEVFNITSESCWRVGDVLNYLLSMSDTKIVPARDEERMRPSDVPYLHGSSAKLRKYIDWVPRYTVEQSEIDLLEYWEDKLLRSR